jgi:hypothetical protein
MCTTIGMVLAAVMVIVLWSPTKNILKMHWEERDYANILLVLFATMVVVLFAFTVPIIWEMF